MLYSWCHGPTVFDLGVEHLDYRDLKVLYLFRIVRALKVILFCFRQLLSQRQTMVGFGVSVRVQGLIKELTFPLVNDDSSKADLQESLLLHLSEELLGVRPCLGAGPSSNILLDLVPILAKLAQALQESLVFPLLPLARIQ